MFLYQWDVGVLAIYPFCLQWARSWSDAGFCFAILCNTGGGERGGAWASGGIYSSTMAVAPIATIKEERKGTALIRRLENDKDR